MAKEIGMMVNRPMVDLSKYDTSTDIGFYSHASASKKLGFGAIYRDRWIRGDWTEEFITAVEPSIEFLELFALVAGLLTWQEEEGLCNNKISIHCDNQAVVHMINNLSSGCCHCMVLIRLITLNGLKYNWHLSARYIKSKDNKLSDALSRNQMDCFRAIGPHVRQHLDSIWPLSKLWKF